MVKAGTGGGSVAGGSGEQGRWQRIACSVAVTATAVSWWWRRLRRGCDLEPRLREVSDSGHAEAERHQADETSEGGGSRGAGRRSVPGREQDG